MTTQEYHTRFKDCPWYSGEYPPVTIGGVGGIGSWLAFLLGRIGVPMHLHDYDSIDYTNMGGQLYPTSAIGKNKADAVMENVRAFSGNVPMLNLGKFNGQRVNPITFACFDNMYARRIMFDSWYESNKYKRLSQPSLFIDGRMTVESFQILAVTQETAEEYRNTYLFDDSDVDEPMCSMKATSHIGAMIGSQLVQVFTNHMTNFNIGIEIREVPLFQAYEAAFMSTVDIHA